MDSISKTAMASICAIVVFEMTHTETETENRQRFLPFSSLSSVVGCKI
jgi:hypothetical protein